MACDLSIVIVNWNTRESLRACLASLRRTRVGPYRLEQAFPLEKILEGEAEDFLLPAPGGEAG